MCKLSPIALSDLIIYHGNQDYLVRQAMALGLKITHSRELRYDRGLEPLFQAHCSVALVSNTNIQGTGDLRSLLHHPRTAR